MCEVPYLELITMMTTLVPEVFFSLFTASRFTDLSHFVALLLENLWLPLANIKSADGINNFNALIKKYDFFVLSLKLQIELSGIS